MLVTRIQEACTKHSQEETNMKKNLMMLVACAVIGAFVVGCGSSSTEGNAPAPEATAPAAANAETNEAPKAGGSGSMVVPSADANAPAAPAADANAPAAPAADANAPATK
ncbi:MAG: hypothetical protein RLZ87_742 [Armatimonadota bacterium]